MAYPTPAVTTTTAATFIPEIWSDEIVAAYKKNLKYGGVPVWGTAKYSREPIIELDKALKGYDHLTIYLLLWNFISNKMLRYQF